MALSKGGVFRDGGIALGVGALSLLGASTGALAETRGYAISLIHTATYPGKDDCPKGGNGGNTEIQERILMRHGYSKEQAERIVANEGKDDNGHRFNFETRGQLDGHAVGIGDFPTSVPDPQIETVVELARVTSPTASTSRVIRPPIRSRIRRRTSSFKIRCGACSAASRSIR